MRLPKTCLSGLAVLLYVNTQLYVSADEALPEGVLASVNGRPIPQLTLDNVAQQISESGQPAEPGEILEELINLEVLTQAAEALNLDEQEDIAATLQLQYTQTMANAYLARKSAEMTFTDEQLRAEYEAQSDAADTAEFRASHILVETEVVANQVLEELAKGKTFANLANELSVDSNGTDGGDLGWFQGSTMTPEFAAAVARMEVGDITQSPIQSDYGYHIIRLADKREAALPDFESVKPGLTNLALRRALAEHVDELKSAADIKKQ
ncbi:MAG: peptidylprolyl isomerase [Granulosicoccus sp.]